MTRLGKAINKIIFECLKIRNSESLLVIADEANSEVGNLFLKKAADRKVESYLLKIPTPKSADSDPSPALRRFIGNANAIVLATEPPLVHSKIIAHACHNGGRVICLNETDMAVLEQAVNADYRFVERVSRRIADIFSIGRNVAVQTRAGTNITFKISRHKGNANHGCARSAGEFGILPAGEAYVTPDKGTMRGIVVVDGSVPEIGLVKSSLKLYVKNGFVTQIIGDELAAAIRKRIKPFGKNGRNVAEFGVGTNPEVELYGNSLADEKKFGTAHIALGNHLFEGGSTVTKLHLDMIFQKPTITIDGRPLIVSGKLVE
ncbi:MAG: aminopeptidase [Calditrichaeota bacterium]|nr:aminopeptidase [Calditrichota bacterium]